MNGEVNGTEDPMDTSTGSPKEKLNTGKTENVEAVADTQAPGIECEESKTLDSNHVDTASNDEQSDNSCSNSKDDDVAKSKSSLTQENGSKESVTNHCSNSNDSCGDSVSSSHPPSESAVHEAEEKNKDVHDLDDIESCEGESESDEDSVLSGPLKATDTVSIDSDSDDDDSSQESRTKSKNSDIIILDAENRPGSLNGNSKDSGSPEIHEITSDNDNDDCVMTNSPSPRRSSRAIKHKSYDDMLNGGDESDIEEVELDDPLEAKHKPAKQAKTKDKSDQEKLKESIGKIPQNLYQSMIARGLVVTPTTSAGSKITTSTQVSPVPPATSPLPTPTILPSLTDDMFVVEAPSFIVPYVYEKPSVQPFREFVDKMGKELEEIKAKEDAERLKMEKEEKEKAEKDRKERRERGEEVEDSPVDDEPVEEEKKKKKAEKKARKRRGDEDDDASWDGEESSDTEDETLSDDDTVVLKDKVDSMEDVKDVTNLTADKLINTKSDNYFDCSLGKFFVDIGLNLVQEYVQTDLLKQQNRKLYREKKRGQSTKSTLSSIASLTKNINFSKQTNAPYVFPQKKCEFCSFKTESELALRNHLETPHMKNNLYKCNFCEFEIKSPHEILSHMDAKHNIRGRLERAPQGHQCPNCPFEDNGKGKLARHQVACAKRYKPENNLAPPIEWEPPAKIPKITRARNVGMGGHQPALKPPMGSLGRGALAGGFRARGRSPALTPAGRGIPIAGAPLIRGGMLMRHNAPSNALLPNNYPPANNGKSKSMHQPSIKDFVAIHKIQSNVDTQPANPAENNGKSKSMHQPSISITPLPHQAPPVQVPQQAAKSTFVICEICDGYIKDLEQLRNHMQWIHKVKIHPKMIYNRPPLNCQKCQFRFFTDQGLERHLLGSHGLVTSSMQEAANKGKDAGRCPVCGRVYQWKLLNHVARDHNLTLKPAHLSYKCTVCTATFGMYKQFENHVYSAHSVVAKRVMDKTKTSAAAKPSSGDSLLKPIKIRDEITITPQPSKPQTSKK